MKQLFPTRNIVMTRGVQQLTLDFKEVGNVIRPTMTMNELKVMLDKHFMNMGEECYADKRLNKQAIANMDGRVFSVFTFKDIKFYIITDGLHLYNSTEYKDYPLTTILLPEEY